jgi:hypothetical protein
MSMARREAEPGFGDQPVLHPVDGDAVEVDAAAVGGDASEGARKGRLAAPVRRDEARGLVERHRGERHLAERGLEDAEERLVGLAPLQLPVREAREAVAGDAFGHGVVDHVDVGEGVRMRAREEAPHGVEVGHGGPFGLGWVEGSLRASTGAGRDRAKDPVKRQDAAVDAAFEPDVGEHPVVEPAERRHP